MCWAVQQVGGHWHAQVGMSEQKARSSLPFRSLQSYAKLDIRAEIVRPLPFCRGHWAAGRAGQQGQGFCRPGCRGWDPQGRRWLEQRCPVLALGHRGFNSLLLQALTPSPCNTPLAKPLQALAAGVGPQAPGWDTVAAALKAAKTDISKPVRDAAAGALPLVAGLLEFAASGAPRQQWPVVCGSLLVAETSGGKRAAVGGARAKMAAACKADEPGPPSQLIAAVHLAAPLLLATTGSPYGAAPLAAAPMPQPPLFMPAAGLPVQTGMPPAYPPAVMPPTLESMAAVPPPLAVTVPPAALQDGSQLTAQLASIQQQQVSMAAALSAFTTSTQTTLQQMQLHLSSVSAGVAALAAGSSSSAGNQAQAIQAHLASANAGVAALAVGVGGAQQMLASVGACSACGPAAALSGATCGSPTTAAGSPGSAASSCPKRLSSLHRSYNALERDLLVRQQGACLPGSPTAVLTAPAAAPPSAVPGADHPNSTLAAPAAPVDWEAAYAQLLGGSGGVVTDQQAQLKLLRCMARSGPVWEQLSPATGQRLMQAITALLQVSKHG